MADDRDSAAKSGGDTGPDQKKGMFSRIWRLDSGDRISLASFVAVVVGGAFALGFFLGENRQIGLNSGRIATLEREHRTEVDKLASERSTLDAARKKAVLDSEKAIRDLEAARRNWRSAAASAKAACDTRVSATLVECRRREATAQAHLTAARRTLDAAREEFKKCQAVGAKYIQVIAANAGTVAWCGLDLKRCAGAAVGALAFKELRDSATAWRAIQRVNPDKFTVKGK